MSQASPVITACTPGKARAAVTSTSSNSAWAQRLRRILPTKAPAAGRSAV